MQVTKLEESYDAIVGFENVDYSHPNGTIALKNVSFQLGQGELLAILGSNGAGKTTLVRHINGLLKATHGNVRVFGEDAKLSTTAKLSRKVGIVFQNPNNQLFEQSVKEGNTVRLTQFRFFRKFARGKSKLGFEHIFAFRVCGEAAHGTQWRREEETLHCVGPCFGYQIFSYWMNQRSDRTLNKRRTWFA